MENESTECLTDAVTSSSHLTRSEGVWILDREKVEDAVTMMLNEHTEAEYDTARKYMYSIVEGKQITLEQEPESSMHS
ncbi:hypothetical protein GQ600_260 [Phytophthora cactorum]|nr:hypothetical protein GQ600_260 [Phytophthora cactorum]